MRVSVMRQGGSKRSPLNIYIPAAIPEAPEPTYSVLKRMINKRVHDKLTIHFRNNCIRSGEQLRGALMVPAHLQVCHSHHSNTMESSILNRLGLL